MQSTNVGGGSGDCGGGGGEMSRSGLSRIRSAPATWIETLLEEEDEEEGLKPNLCLTELLTGTDGFFSNFGIPANYDYLSPNVDISPTKRSRDMETQFSSQMKEEQMSGGISGMMDMNMDKLLEDSVPCRVRAKRGCATHPRSIAERVRRTRISDRIRRLQELVPNMDKQTNTADMLEEAVEYVKTLQSQIQELTEQQKRCRCKPKEEQ
ncbi:transcription factor bHLH80 isoform X2 [Capsella rubella]|uniref:transcription factor bHLH80 isoform X2 n=1 Tax=Capsella rubella TaxID=81985 RepID=UPI000CD51E49|nr:transcription factor bHLH80 isoform X2 [Capsella rubella]